MNCNGMHMHNLVFELGDFRSRNTAGESGGQHGLRLIRGILLFFYTRDDGKTNSRLGVNVDIEIVQEL